MNCTRCGKPGAESVTIGNVHYVRCEDCFVTLARELEQKLADGVEAILETEQRIAESERLLAKSEQRELLILEESAIKMSDACREIERHARAMAPYAAMLAANDPSLDPADADRLAQAAETARAALRKVWDADGLEAFRERHREACAAYQALLTQAAECFQFWAAAGKGRSPAGTAAMLAATLGKHKRGAA